MRFIVLFFSLFFFQQSTFAQLPESHFIFSGGLIFNNQVKTPLTENMDKIPFFARAEYLNRINRNIGIISGVSLWKFSDYNYWEILRLGAIKKYSFNENFFAANIQTGLHVNLTLLRMGTVTDLSIYFIPQVYLEPFSLGRVQVDIYSDFNSEGVSTLNTHKSVYSTSWLNLSYYGEAGFSLSDENDEVGFSLGCYVSSMDVYRGLRSKSIDGFQLSNVLPENKLYWGICVRLFGSL